MSKQVVEDLKAARELISDPKRWTQGVSARDALGESVSSGSDDATCFCAIGALTRVTGDFSDRYYAARAYLWSFVSNKYGTGVAVADVNDEHGHTAVLEVFDKGIALAEASS